MRETMLKFTYEVTQVKSKLIENSVLSSGDGSGIYTFSELCKVPIKCKEVPNCVSPLSSKKARMRAAVFFSAFSLIEANFCVSCSSRRMNFTEWDDLKAEDCWDDDVSLFLKSSSSASKFLSSGLF